MAGAQKNVSKDPVLKLYAPDESMKPLITALAVGDNPALDEQLIQKSKQNNILKFTPKDASKRFGNASMLEEWRKKGRIIHWLLGENNDLAGIIWYGKSKFPLEMELSELPDETFAIRIYDGYSGHGLAVPFMKLSLKALVETRRQEGQSLPCIWLQTDITNPAAITVYNKLGYKEVARDALRVTMVLSPDEILTITQT